MARRPTVRRPSEAEIEGAVRQTQIKAYAIAVPASILAVAVVAWACTPLAHAIAGRKTDFEVNVTLSLSIVLSFTTTIAGSAAMLYRRTNRRVRARNTEMEGKITDTKRENVRLEQEVTAAHGRIQDLEEAAG